MKTMRLLAGIAAVSAIALSAGAASATVNLIPKSWGAIPVGGTSFNYTAPKGTDEYEFSFTLPTAGLYTVSTDAIALAAGLSNASFTLYKVGNATPITPTIIDTFLVASIGDVGESFNLKDGSYTLDYLVTATRATAFQASADAAPVPEAATWAMMISGLALVGWALRRRSFTVARQAYTA